MAAAGSHWRVAVMRPQDDPMRHLAHALARIGGLPALLPDAAAVEAVVETTLRRSGLGLIEAARMARLPPGESLLILVDQFEELFRFAALADSQGAAEDAPAFVKLLLEAVRQRDVSVYVVITMRSDFLGDCARFRGLPEAISESQYLVPRMTRDDLRAVITGPVGVRGGGIAPALVQRLLNEVGDDPDQLPVLQHALMRTWDRWNRRTPMMSEDDLDAVGSMARALSLHADEAYAALAGDAERAIAERLFKCLCEREPSNREVRRPTRLSVIAKVTGVPFAEVVPVIETFRAPGRAFLMPPYDVPLEADDPVDIAHESLIRQWQRLRVWVEEEAEAAAVYRDLVYAARRYRRHKGALWVEPDLSRGRQWQEKQQPNPAWADRYGPGLDEALEFLRDSEAAQAAVVRAEQQKREAEDATRERELRQAQALAETERLRADTHARANAAQRRFIGATVALLLVAAVAAVIAWRQATALKDQRDRARMGGVLASSVAALATDPELGMLIALTAIDPPDGRMPTNVLELADALSRSMSVSRLRGHFVIAKGNQLRLVAYSSDGSMLATEGEGDSIVIRDPESAGPLFPPIANDKPVAAMAFSSRQVAIDGGGRLRDVLAIASGNTVRLHGIGDPPFERVLRFDKDIVSIDFGRGGELLAAAEVDGRITIWDVRSGARVETRGAMKQFYAFQLSFSADGKTLASASNDRTVQIWDAATGEPRMPRLTVSSDELYFVRLSPDGQLLATGGKDSMVSLWEVAKDTLKLHRELYGHVNSVFDVAFGNEGRVIVTGSADATLRLYDVDSGRELRVLRGPSDPIAGVAFSSDKDRVASVGWDGALRIWSVRGLVDKVTMTAFSDDGERLLTANPDSTVPFWNAGTGEVAAYGSIGAVRSLCLSADASHMATGKTSGEVQLWSGTKLVRTLDKHDREAIMRVSFSLDGRRLASLSENHAFVWDVDSDRPIFEMSPDQFVFDDFIALNAAGTYAATAERSGKFKLWRVGTGPIALAQPESARDRARGVVFSFDGQWLAGTLESGKILLWNMAHPETQPRVLEPRGYVMDVKFSRQGDRLAAANINKTAQVWDLSSPDKAPVSLQGHDGAIEAIAFSADGRRIVTGSWDRTARIWDANSGALLGVLNHEREVKDVVFSSDGGRVTTVTIDGVVRVHPFDVEQLKAMAHARATRSLTTEECRTYLRDLPCP